MRKFSKLEIILTHEENADSTFSIPVVEMKNGKKSVPVNDFEKSLRMLPPQTEVTVIATGTVGNTAVHNISRIIRESSARVFLDLSEVKELSRVSEAPFRGNENLVSMIFPGNLASINSCAFENCKNLERVVIPKTVRKIGEQAFSGCEKLSYLEFEDSSGWNAPNTKLENINLSNPEDNPYRFSLFSSPYRLCTLEKISENSNSPKKSAD